MELLSDLVSWGEEFKNHWEDGIYKCARCSNHFFPPKTSGMARAFGQALEKRLTTSAL